MFIDKETYKLTNNNFFEVKSLKNKIILGSTNNNDMKHIIGWKNRYNGGYKKTAAFTISATGFIFEHFDPSYQSNILNNHVLDSTSIVILIENLGRLNKDLEKNQFITWIDDIYKEDNSVYEKKWRNYTHWQAFSNKQIESSILLVKHLCHEFAIPMSVIGHNTKIDDVKKNTGIFYRSNIEKHYTDLNPSWDFECFKNKVENI